MYAVHREQEGNTSKADVTARVDMLNIKTGEWTTAELCWPRKKLDAATVSLPGGDKAIFGGGYQSGGGNARAEWDMYDSASGKWTSGNLSSPRMRIKAAAVGDSAFFISGMNEVCGGHCPQIDIYNGQSLYLLIICLPFHLDLFTHSATQIKHQVVS